ncbi:hypothetical protein UT300013_23250 [Paraclostridium sordellii]
MRKIISIVMITAMLIGVIPIKANAESGLKRETRAIWISTVWNMDWPTKVGDINAQKEEFIKILDEVNGLGFNTVVVQVRPKADALYKSNINPWSDVLTGTQGKDPGYDPLEFMISEAHKRNLDIHAWFNPYRITASNSENDKLASNHQAKLNPNWVVNYGGKLYYNPGVPEVRQHIVDTVSEVVRNYDIDGIHFDDYFYPGKDFNDQDAYNKYGDGKSIDEFRRDSVNKMVESVHSTIKNIKSYVKFGISPRGIWRNKSSDPTGSDTNGSQSYDDIYADTRTWIQNGWIDYVVPQVYWEMGHPLASYSKLIPWWSNEVKNKNTSLYIGQGIYKDSVAQEIDKQIDLNRTYNEVKGSMYFTYSDIKNNRQGARDKVKIKYKYPALPENMTWIDSNPPDSPKITVNKNINSNKIDINNVKDASYYIIYRFNNDENININDPSKILAKVKNSGELVSSYIDTNTSGTNYNYVVTSVDRLHNESGIYKEPEDGIIYQTHIQDYGWQDWKSNGEISGTEGQSKRLEAIRINLKNIVPQADINYRAHVQDYGWQDWKSNGEISGTEGQGKRLEAIQLKLVNAPGYHLEYRVHVQDIGWQDWKTDGEISGTSGQSKRLEAIQVKLVKDIGMEYKSHVQDIGWQDWKSNGEISGTEGQEKRLEAIEIKLKDASKEEHIKYRVHVQDIGWQDWKEDGELGGTEGQSKRLEAIEIKLENTPGYHLEYRGHVQDYGWQDWKTDGETVGTNGQSKRLEAIQLRIVKN